MRRFRHNKTGREYELVQMNIKFKDYMLKAHILDGYMSTAYTVDSETMTWRDGLVLYKALYDNPDGPYFVRHSEDFFNNFTEIL